MRPVWTLSPHERRASELETKTANFIYIKYILSNLVENDKLWIKDIAYSAEAEKVYADWSKRQQSLMYIFKDNEVSHF